LFVIDNPFARRLNVEQHVLLVVIYGSREVFKLGRRPLRHPATLHAVKNTLVWKGDHDVGKMSPRREFGAKPLNQRRAPEARHFHFDGWVCLTKLVGKAFGTCWVQVVIQHHFAFFARCGLDGRPVIGLCKGQRRGDDQTGHKKGE
jgi:hypothetical protein